MRKFLATLALILALVGRADASGISYGEFSNTATTPTIELSGTCYAYDLHFDLKQSGGDKQIVLEVSANNGSTWQTSGYSWGWIKTDNNADGSAGAAEGIGSSGSSYGGTESNHFGRIGSNSGQNMAGLVKLVRPDVAEQRRISWLVASAGGSSTQSDRAYAGGGALGGGGAFNAVRLRSTSGNVTGSYNLSCVEYGTAPVPVATDDTDTATKNTQKTITFNSLKVNDTLNGATTIASVQNASNCSVSLSGGDVIFTPATDFTGSATFTYTLTNSAGSDNATVTVTVSEAGGGGTWHDSVDSDWQDKDANISFPSAGAMSANGEGAAHTSVQFSGDFEAEVTIGSETHFSFGAHLVSADGSFSNASQFGNLNSFSGTFGYNGGDDKTYNGTSVVASGNTLAANDVLNLKRVGSGSNNIEIKKNGSSIGVGTLVGTVRLVAGAGGTSSVTVRWK